MSYTFGDQDWFSGNVRYFIDFLSPLANRSCKLLEVGVWEGRSTAWLLDNVAKVETSTITCIDPSAPAVFKTNFASASRVELFEKPSRDILPLLPKAAYDFIYIDGSHATIDVLEDAVHSFRLAKVGGVIAFDDYRWNDRVFSQYGGTPKAAIDAFCRIYRSHLKIMTGRWCWQRWVTKLSEP